MSLTDKIKGAKSDSLLTNEFSDKELKLLRLKSSISSSIQAQRKRLELSQADLARTLGVTQGLISRWENGEENFTLETLINIGDALGIELVNPLQLSIPVYGKVRRAEHVSGKAPNAPSIDFGPIRQKALQKWEEPEDETKGTI